MIARAQHDDEWLAEAMRDSDRGEDIQAIARMLFSRRGYDESADENSQQFVTRLAEKKMSPSQKL